MRGFAPMKMALGIVLAGSIRFVAAQGMEPVLIVTQPADQTVEVGKNATFAVEASGTDLRYQWFLNGNRINGATNFNLRTAPATLTMSGAGYSVAVSNAINSVTSETAILTVVPDKTGPVVQYAAVTGPTFIEIQFDEPVLRARATNAANYSLLRLGDTNRIGVTNTAFAFNRIRLAASQILNPLNNYVVCMADITDGSTNFMSSNPQCIGVGFPETNRVVSFGELWRYNDVATNTLPPAWKQLDYDDDPFDPPFHWAEGYAALGYTVTAGFAPCSPARTPLSGGAMTYYFRKRFVLAEDYPADTVVRLGHEIDDGAVFYVNGVELYRTPNIPAGTVNYFTRAGHVSTAACVSVAIPMPSNVFTKGVNLLAVEVHQALEPQTHLIDVMFDAELSLEYRRPPIVPQLHVAHTASGVMLRWEGNGWALEVAENIFGPWSRLPTEENRYVSPLNAPGGRRFFRLANP